VTEQECPDCGRIGCPADPRYWRGRHDWPIVPPPPGEVGQLWQAALIVVVAAILVALVMGGRS
jgi:hypothetical protein